MSELLTTVNVKIENAIAELIRTRLGIVIHKHQKKDLQKTIMNACQIFQCTPQNYLNMLISQAVESPVYEHLIAGITIGESYFFRDKNQMQLLQNTILPRLIKEKRLEQNLSLRIWSAGCASGEEIYTVAMLLVELLPDIQQWTLQLLGSDINTESLKKAIKGHYKEWSMRNIQERFKKRYFKLENSEYIITDEIKKLVNFSYINLCETNLPSIMSETNAQDLIICRNVLIYFDDEHVEKLMKRFVSNMGPTGYLLLGASDPVILSGTKLKYHFKAGALFSFEHQTIKEYKILFAPLTQIMRTPPMITVQKKVETVPVPINKSVVTEQDIKIIEALIIDANWHQAFTTIHALLEKGVKNAYLLNTQATVCANLGKLQEAKDLLEMSLTLEPMNTLTYFTLAMTLLELNKIKEAELAFRKSIYLDHQFLVGHFQLGLLLIKKKQIKEGLKHLQNALKIAKGKDPFAKVPGFNELHFGELADIFANEIKLHAARGGKS